MKQIFYFLKRFLIGVAKFLLFIIVFVVASIYNLIVFEPGKKGVLTVRKANRIRRFTKYKIYISEHCPKIVKWTKLENYFIDLKKRLSYGV